MSQRQGGTTCAPHIEGSRLVQALALKGANEAASLGGAVNRSGMNRQSNSDSVIHGWFSKCCAKWLVVGRVMLRHSLMALTSSGRSLWFHYSAEGSQLSVHCRWLNDHWHITGVLTRGQRLRTHSKITVITCNHIMASGSPCVSSLVDIPSIF